jgi:diguanylate cyclase (GGDEF)-like protein
MQHNARIALVSSDEQRTFAVQLRLQSKGYQTTVMSCASGVLGAFYSDPPDLLLIDLSATGAGCSDLIPTLRSDSFFSTIPIIGMLDSLHDEEQLWQSCLLDDFISLPLNFAELFCRISLALSRIKRIFDNNPLTRLPGNTSIQRAIEAAIGSDLAVCYVDINHFKPYNDVYGFGHGDEVIRMLSRIMFNAVRDSGGGFSGHIGGDDFVCIVPLVQSETVCQTIIQHFDRIVLDLFEENIKTQGYYIGHNREGTEQQIPLLSVSIGVVPMHLSKITHSAKVAEVAAELKKRAKHAKGSCFVIDQRAK